MNTESSPWRYLSSREPLRVWLVWHPENAAAAALAEGVAAGLGPTGDPQRAGAGLPIYFATGGEGGEPPPLIPLGKGSDSVAVVPLICARMVADVRWRRWLIALRQRTAGDEDAQSRQLIAPVALDAHGYRMPGINDLGYLQIDPPKNGGAIVELARFRAERLTQRLVVALTRQLLGTRRLTLFISHAKVDGRDIAVALRDRIVAYDQLEFFFDENDLPSGHPFDVALDKATSAHGSPAMIVVQTGHYAERPWCRRELARFRRPTRTEEHIWHQRPMIVIDGLEDKPTRILAEAAGATVLRWRPGAEAEMLDGLMREVLMSEYRRRRAVRVQAEHPRPGRVVLDWVPEPYSIGWVRAEALDLQEIVYPGDGLNRVDRDALTGAVPRAQLTTFAEALHRRPKRPERTGALPVLALSAGMPGDTERLASGLGHDAVYAVLVRLCRHLLGTGHHLSYGGKLAGHSFTEALRALVRADEPVIVDRQAGPRDPYGRPMLISFTTHTDSPEPATVARDLGLVRYVPLADGFTVPDGSSDALELALRISAMRRGMHRERTAIDEDPVSRPIARIVLGGKSSGFSGFASGVAEEVALALDAEVPVFVLGVLGGGAAMVGRALLDGDTAAARALTASETLGTEPSGDATRRLVTGLAKRRDALTSNRLSLEENRALFEAEDLDEALRLLTLGLSQLRSDQS